MTHTIINAFFLLTTLASLIIFLYLKDKKVCIKYIAICMVISLTSLCVSTVISANSIFSLYVVTFQILVMSWVTEKVIDKYEKYDCPCAKCQQEIVKIHTESELLIVCICNHPANAREFEFIFKYPINSVQNKKVGILHFESMKYLNIKMLQGTNF